MGGEATVETYEVKRTKGSVYQNFNETTTVSDDKGFKSVTSVWKTFDLPLKIIQMANSKISDSSVFDEEFEKLFEETCR